MQTLSYLNDLAVENPVAAYAVLCVVLMIVARKYAKTF
jgi:hypothetical protein